jgi:hypothetical protein
MECIGNPLRRGQKILFQNIGAEFYIDFKNINLPKMQNAPKKMREPDLNMVRGEEETALCAFRRITRLGGLNLLVVIK